MKKVICFLLALVMTALSLASCDRGPSAGGGTGDVGTGGNGDDTDKNGGGLIHGNTYGDGEFAVGGGFYAWGDFMFNEVSVQTDHGVVIGIVFHDMADPEAEWMVLDFGLAECDIPKGFEASVDHTALLVDDAATAENGGVPVFAAVYTLELSEESNPHNKRSETRVAAFDMKTQKLTMIKSGIEGSLCSAAYLYKGRLYFDTQPLYDDEEHGEFFRTLNMIKLDGGEHKTMDGFDTVLLSLDYIADDVIYYSAGGKIYSSALDFSGLSYLFDAYQVFYEDSEYIYYLTSEDLTTNYDTSFSLCRKKVDDISAPAETLLSSDVLTGRNCTDYGLFGSDLYFETKTDDGNSVIYRYDIKTGEYGKLLEHEGDVSVGYSTGDYLLAYVRKGPYICVDKETGEYTTLERWPDPF